MFSFVSTHLLNIFRRLPVIFSRARKPIAFTRESNGSNDEHNIKFSQITSYETLQIIIIIKRRGRIERATCNGT